MKKSTEKILIFINVLAWITFIGLMVKAGAILFSYVFTLFKPEASANLYLDWNFSELRGYSFLHYTQSVIFMFALPAIKAYIAYLVVEILSAIKLANPFTKEISRRLELISYVILFSWFVNLAYGIHTAWLLEYGVHIPDIDIPGESLFLAGIVFVMAQIFKKGVELQSENELTV